MGGQSTGFIWTPTKRRAPIAAEFSTPGPAVIGLPSTFGSNSTVKSRSPAFTISGRHESKPAKAGPGPGQYNINGLSHKGKDEPHASSMHIRPKDPRPFVTPAPGDYCPEKSSKVMDQSPKFSFGIKTEQEVGADIPAPNSYNIPSLIGTSKSGGVHSAAPCFTMSGRPREEEDKMKIPGPGSYNEALVDNYKRVKSPAFSMGQRTNIPTDSTRKPGPGAHSPEKCMRDQGPKFTMSCKLNGVKPNKVPGPGSYNAADMDNYFEKRPSYTMAPRTELPTDKGPRPSPNAYSPDKYIEHEGPSYTMAPRLNPLSKLNVPGPGSYEAGDLNSYLDKRPLYTMAPKTELPKDKTPRPSPNAYYPEKYDGDEGPSYTMGERLNEIHKMKVPGPGTYDAGELDSYLNKRPVFTMAPRTELPKDKTLKPSPNAYYPEKYDGDEGPSYTMGERLNEIHKMKVPGPGTYDAGELDCYLNKRPVFTMAPRTELPKDKTPRPSPNTYYPEKYVEDEGPSYTMAPRLNEISQMNVPGPGSYEAGELDSYMEKKPSYTMAPKTELPVDKSPKPSPNTYSPEKSMKKENPEFSFGIKHSIYLGKLRVQ